MSFTVYDKNGTPVSGDGVVDQGMRDYADSLGGYIKDDQTGETVHPQED